MNYLWAYDVDLLYKQYNERFFVIFPIYEQLNIHYLLSVEYALLYFPKAFNLNSILFYFKRSTVFRVQLQESLSGD